MMRHPFLEIFRRHRTIILFSTLLTFCSGFGQSFFISLFVPTFQKIAAIGNKEFGILYATVTLLGGLCLPYFGGKLDHANPRIWIFFSIIGMQMAAFSVAASSVFPYFSLLFIGTSLFGLRLFGQGLLGHIAATIVGKKVEVGRGVALSLSSLGYPLSEAILPLAGAFFIEALSFSTAWILFGVAIGLILLPFPIWYQKELDDLGPIDLETQAPEPTAAPARALWRQGPFWFWGIGCLVPPTALTALFIYHGALALEKDWDLSLIAANFIFFAASRFLFSIYGGVLIDRFGPKRLYPLFLLPLALSFLVLILGTGYWSVVGYLFLAGASIGIHAPLKTSLLAEVFGTEVLARVRSQLMTFAIIGSALGPAVLGFLLDADFLVTEVLTYTFGGLMLFIVSWELWKGLWKTR